MQAEYWHDPLSEETYQEGSIFLADINNEKVKNAAYKKNLLKLDNLVLVKFEEDTMVQPRETSWFEFYTPGQGVEITPLNQSDIYVKVSRFCGILNFLNYRWTERPIILDYFYRKNKGLLKEQDYLLFLMRTNPYFK